MMKTVLYIDDSADDLFLFQRACKMAEVSFHLELAEGSGPGRQYLAGGGEFADRRVHPLPDFILLDIKMPEADGFDVLKWIRAHPRVSQTMVALYSSSTVDKDVLRGYLTGTTYYIPKPHGIDMLAELALGLDECLQTGECSSLLKLSMAPAQL